MSTGIKVNSLVEFVLLPVEFYVLILHLSDNIGSYRIPQDYDLMFTFAYLPNAEGGGEGMGDPKNITKSSVIQTRSRCRAMPSFN